MCRLLVGRFYDSGGGVLLWRGWVGDGRCEMGDGK